MTTAPLVSVVIPSYNAAATLDETLRSARGQTHQALEIIVVNDGSTDQTRAIAQQHAAVDGRVQILDQRNAGLAAARNAGWRSAQSDLIAFLDADDLWAPHKIERQVDALQAGGDKIGLVYCGSVRIDAQGVVTGQSPVSRFEGDVLERIVTGNFIGNGSVVLVRRRALLDANGFETALREAGAEGCEDYLLQCRIAEKYHFAVVPEELVGYRYLPYNMSSNRPRMLRSWMLVVDEMTRRHPQLSGALRSGMRNYAGWIVRDAISSRDLSQLPALVRLTVRCPAAVAVDVLLKDLPMAVVTRLGSRFVRMLRSEAKPAAAQTGRKFFIREPD